MSLSRHAYRHALQPATFPFLEHVWISEDFLTSTFRRFANGPQRRHGSRVPGPMEARRRLAKRKNTALANIAASGPLDDVSFMFGKNGREHVKWRDSRVRKSRPSDRVSSQVLDRTDPPFQFCAEDVILPEEDETPANWPVDIDLQTADRDERDKFLKDYLKKHWKVSEISDVVRLLGIDFRQEPDYSRLVLDHLLSRSNRTKGAVDELAVFLDDPFLNTQGAENYIAAVKHLTLLEASSAKRGVILDAITRALELGMIPPDELCTILRTMPKVRSDDDATGRQDQGFCLRFYRTMWDAIGRCYIMRHEDLDQKTVDVWLSVLEETGTLDATSLAKDIILATQDSNFMNCQWVTTFIVRRLHFSTKIDLHTHAEYVQDILNHFDSDAAPRYIIRVTEAMAFSNNTEDRILLFEKWRESLSGLRDIHSLARSRDWKSLRRPDFDVADRFVSKKPSKSTKQHQIILRLWLLRTLSKSLGDGPMWRPIPRVTDQAILRLFERYETATKEDDDDDGLMISLLKGLSDLEIPFNGLLMMAVDLKAVKRMGKGTRKTFHQLEDTNMSITDLFTDIQTYNATSPYFFSAFERMIRAIDVTSPEFIEQSIQLAQNGDSEQIWTLIRIIRSHTPLKIALSRAWVKPPDPSEMALVRYYPEPRTSECPDPTIALELIHLLAIASSCSKTLSPARAFHFVRWLYHFLMKHDAPVKPSLIRALYEAGVMRYRRKGEGIARTRHNYIYDLILEYETPEVAQAMMNPYVIGQSESEVP